MKANHNGQERFNEYLADWGRRAVQNNPSCASTNLMDTTNSEDFGSVGRRLLDSVDVRGPEGAQELRLQIKAARQFAISQGRPTH